MGVWIRDPEESTIPILNDKIKIMKITPLNAVKILRWMVDTFPPVNDPINYYVTNHFLAVPLLSFGEQSGYLQEILSTTPNAYFAKGVKLGYPNQWCIINADIFNVFEKKLILGQEFEIVDDVFV